MVGGQFVRGRLHGLPGDIEGLFFALTGSNPWVRLGLEPEEDLCAWWLRVAPRSPSSAQGIRERKEGFDLIVFWQRMFLDKRFPFLP